VAVIYTRGMVKKRHVTAT